MMQRIVRLSVLCIVISSLVWAESEIVVDDSFGKTHFIKGYPHDENLLEAKDIAPEAKVSRLVSTKTLFSPDDDIRAELLHRIAQEKEAIFSAIFLLTDGEIAKALVDAHKRGVKVELITDASCLKERSSKINMMCDGGCTVYIYNPAYRKNDMASIMHHKFVLFAHNNGNKEVWTGSYNFTQAANKSNQENVVIVQDEESYKRFNDQFKKLKERAHHYGKTKVK